MDILKLKSLLREKNMTYEDLARKTNLSISTIKKILSGSAKYPRIDTVEVIEKALGINQPIIELPNMQPIGNGLAPLVGQVVAGIPIETSEYLEGYITIDYPHPEEYFGLRVNGDSMINARIFPNDILIVHKQSYAENGDIIVASINGESTVKRYKIFGESVFLMPENSAYEPIPIINTNELFIFGKVVEIRNRL